MDFSRVALSDGDQAFQDELRAFLGTIVTDEVIARDRQTGENFDEGVEDKYRIGEVNGGWTVLRNALNDEHGTVEREADGLERSPP